jgi:putative hydrolase of HD superfamily
MENQRLEQQLAFVLELERLKNIYRQTLVLHEDRQENDAEHSFHLALMAAVLAEHAKEPADVLHVMKMVLIHDAVEVDAGDTYAYDTAGNATKRERELQAADRIFALLPDDQAKEYRALWDEFEARETPEAKFANTLDRIQPLLLNYKKGGISWKRRGIRAEQVRNRNHGVTEEGSDTLGALCYEIIEAAKQEGMLL